jgi:hypothetical protein
MALLAYINSQLTGSSGGVCFGISRGSNEFIYHGEPLSNYLPHTATTVWGLTDRASNPDLATYLTRQAITQFSAEYLHYWLGQALNNIGVSSNYIAAEIQGALQAGDSPIITMRHGGGGHAVVAYDLEDDGQGGYYVDVYDSNRQFLASENTDGPGHQTNEDGSRIHLQSNGLWSFKMADGDLYGGPYSDLSNTLLVVPFDTIPSHPTLPTTLDGLKTLVFGSSGAGKAATVTQLTDAAGHTLIGADGRLNTDPHTRLDAAPFAFLNGGAPSNDMIYLVGGDSAVTETVQGNSTGTYSATLFGNGVAAQVDGPSTPGATDQLSLDSQGNGFTFNTDAPQKSVSIDLIAHATDGSAATAAISTTSFQNAGDRVTFDPAGKALTYHHAGAATTLTLALSWTGAQGQPATFTTPALHLVPGDAVTIAQPGGQHAAVATALLTLTHRGGGQTQQTLHPASTALHLFGLQ